MKSKNLAPIALSTYSRINHLKQVIKALQKNTLAKESELYIFSDAPKLGDEEIVAKVRTYIHTINGFKEVHVIERVTNGRVANNRGGMKQLLDEYGKCIFMEDDIVTAPGYLTFINDALEFYKHEKKILSIAGFTPINHDIKNDFYIFQRFVGWGFGIWKDRFDLIDYLPSYNNILKNKELYTSLINMGDDMIRMIKDESNRNIDALDIKACYLSAKNNLYNVIPSKTLVKNIGLDGSGVHCGISTQYEHLDLNMKINFNFSKNIEPNENILKKNFLLYKNKSLINKLLHFIKKYQLLFNAYSL